MNLELSLLQVPWSATGNAPKDILVKLQREHRGVAMWMGQAGMMDSTFEDGGVVVKFRFREAKQDRQHLVVVFAGVRPGEHDFYGFDGKALDNVKGAILWIKDSFEGKNSYYLCAGMDFKIKRAVAALIDATLHDLELTPTQCTLLGGSKGGSAALHFGLSHDYANIVAAVPQSRIGTYARQKLTETFDYMSKGDLDECENQLNAYIPDLVFHPHSLTKNIYLISSQSDPEYPRHIEPLLEGFSKFDNFNLLLSDSTLVQSHPDVTPYNVPFILSTLYALCEGLAPRFGRVSNGNGQRDRLAAAQHFSRRRAAPETMSSFHWVQLRGQALTFRAFAAVIGEAATEPPAEQPELLAAGRNSTHRFELSSLADTSLSTTLYRKYYCDYRWSGIRAEDDSGVALASLEPGSYELSVEFTTATGRHKAKLPGRTILKSTELHGGFAYVLDSSPLTTTISKLSLDGEVPVDGEFQLSLVEVDKAKLYIRGVFAVPREEMREWNEGNFAITFTNGRVRTTFPLGASRSNSGAYRLPARFDPEAHAWAYFSTMGHHGADLSVLPDGLYDGYVSFIRNSRVYTGAQRISVRLSESIASLESNLTPSDASLK